jgi:HlyD family secretion protein
VTAPSISKLVAQVVVAAALAAAAYGAWNASRQAPAELSYRTARVERGPIAHAVTATGTVDAVQTVQVGATAAGRIVFLSADFNTEVRKGQPLARIDPEAHESRLAQAQADLEAARSALAVAQKVVAAGHALVARTRVAMIEAEREAERRRSLAERGFIAPAEAGRAEARVRDFAAEIESAGTQTALQEAQLESARAVVRQRETAAAHARAELARTVVRAPVDGVVVARSAEAGQVVAPGPGSPPLFVIARDLRDMRIEADVAESDVGRLRAGQPATFTVDAFPRRAFPGQVAQIRKSPRHRLDAMTYTAVIAAPNGDLALLPGMSARVRIETETRADALKVPNAALGFNADDAAFGLGRARVWRLDEATRRPVAVDVQLGISDGTYTEVLSEGVSAGDTLVLGTATSLPRAAARDR